MNKLHEDKARYHTLSMDSRSFWLSLDPHIGGRVAQQLPMYNKSIKDFWQPIEFRVAENDGATQVPDWSFYTSGDLILNEKAKNALEQYLLEAGELLPLRSNEDNYYFFNCLVKYDHGQELPEDKSIFKASPTVGIDLICSDRFKNAAQEAGLTGIYFTEDIETLA